MGNLGSLIMQVKNKIAPRAKSPQLTTYLSHRSEFMQDFPVILLPREKKIVLLTMPVSSIAA
jgi:hypothetical protein